MMQTSVLFLKMLLISSRVLKAAMMEIFLFTALKEKVAVQQLSLHSLCYASKNHLFWGFLFCQMVYIFPV